VELKDRRVVITGAGNGIGEALARRFAAEGAASIVVSDLDGVAARRVADDIEGVAVTTDVTRRADLEHLVATASELGPIDLFCSNAGVFGGLVGVDAPDATWDTLWQVNVMAHVHAAQLVLPAMIERGEGYLLNTASAAGLLMNLGAMPYSVTKHAAVAVAEWLSVTHGPQGIKVSCICPQGVNTQMLTTGGADGPGSATRAAGAILEPEDIADATVAGLRAEEFLILPHAEVQRYATFRVTHKEKWIEQLRTMQARLDAERRAAEA
jgi:NAD(P)-dependent dehydrogenase (short-subunit alcohol dehydrogenase family)